MTDPKLDDDGTVRINIPVMKGLHKLPTIKDYPGVYSNNGEPLNYFPEQNSWTRLLILGQNYKNIVKDLQGDEQTLVLYWPQFGNSIGFQLSKIEAKQE